MAPKKPAKASSRPASTSALSQAPSAAALARSHLGVTHPSEPFYAQISRATDAETVRVYDTVSGRCVGRWATEIGAAEGGRVECATWVDLRSSNETATTPSKRGKKRRKSGGPAAEVEEPAPVPTSTQPALALGLSDGSIILLHPTQSTVIKTLSHASTSSAVKSLSCPTGPRHLLWSAAADGSILAWTLPTPDGSGGALQGRASGCGVGWSQLSVRYLNDGIARALVGQHAVQMVDLTLPSITDVYEAVHDLEQTVVGSCTGHATSIDRLVWLDAADVGRSTRISFATSAMSDRTVSIWSLEPAAAEAVLVASLSLDTDVRTIATPSDVSTLAAVGSGEGASVAIVELPESIFVAPAGPSPAKGKRSKSRVHVLQPASEIVVVGSTEGIVDVAFVAASLRTVRGALKPVFDSVAYRDPNGAFLPRVELRATKGKGALSNGDDEAVGAPASRARYIEPSGSVIASGLVPPSAADAPVVNEGALDVDEAGATLAQRLRGLKVVKPGKAPITAGEDDDAMDEDAPAVPSAAEPVFDLAPSASLTQTLVQALHSSDRGLLESCLAHTDAKLIRNTVKRLPAQLVLPLVESLVERLGRSKRGYGAGSGAANVLRGRALVQWLRAVLVVHVSYLVTVPSLVSRLSALHATLDSRLALHDRLLALNGRLELVVSQIDLQREPIAPVASTSSAKAGASASRSRRPVLRYVEGESDDDEAMPIDEGEIEDVALAATPSAADEDDSDDSDENAGWDFEAEERPRLPKKKGSNGFLDLEADDDDDEGDSSDGSDLDSEEDDEDGLLLAGQSARFAEDEDADGDADLAALGEDDDESASDDEA